CAPRCRSRSPECRPTSASPAWGPIASTTSRSRSGSRNLDRRQSWAGRRKTPGHFSRSADGCPTRILEKAHHVDHIELVAEDVHRFVSRHVANCADAADISQEVLTIACANLDTYTEHNDGLFAIARRLIGDYDRANHQVDFVTIDPAVRSEKESALRVP